MAIVALLGALPGTQLTRRLEKEGRLLPDIWYHEGDQCTSGLNFTTLRPRRDVYDDYKCILERVHGADAYFRRVRTVGRLLKRPKLATAPASVRQTLADLALVGRLMWRMMRKQPRLTLRLWTTLLDCALHNPSAIAIVISMMVIYMDIGPFSRFVVREMQRRIDAEQDDRASSVTHRIPQASRSLADAH